MTEIEELRAVVLAQSSLIGQILCNMSENEDTFLLTSDEGHEMIDSCLEHLPPDLRKTYFAQVDRWYPRHSTER